MTSEVTAYRRPLQHRSLRMTHDHADTNPAPTSRRKYHAFRLDRRRDHVAALRARVRPEEDRPARAGDRQQQPHPRRHRQGHDRHGAVGAHRLGEVWRPGHERDHGHHRRRGARPRRDQPGAAGVVPGGGELGLHLRPLRLTGAESRRSCPASPRARNSWASPPPSRAAAPTSKGSRVRAANGSRTATGSSTARRSTSAASRNRSASAAST